MLLGRFVYDFFTRHYILVGLSLAEICHKLNLPRLIGLLISGIVLGPFILDWIAPSLLSISAELRQISLIIILFKAGLSLNLADLKSVGVQRS